MRNNVSKTKENWRIPKTEGKCYKKNPLCSDEMDKYIKTEIRIRKYTISQNE